MSAANRKRLAIQGACLLLLGIAIGFALSKAGSVSLAWRHPAPTPATTEPSGPAEPGVMAIGDLRVPGKDALLLVDARPYLFFKRGHIPGAINVAKQYYVRDFSHHESVLRAPGEKKVVVYCSSSECQDASFVAGKLISAGLKHVYVFTGGWSEWQASRFPEERE